MRACLQVVVFDTTFHGTMPPAAHTYALPKRLRDEQGVRRFGAHGTSYRYIVRKVAELYGAPASDLNLIVAHLGALLTKRPEPRFPTRSGLRCVVHSALVRRRAPHEKHVPHHVPQQAPDGT
jgi:Acetokinase family